MCFSILGFSEGQVLQIPWGPGKKKRDTFGLKKWTWAASEVPGHGRLSRCSWPDWANVESGQSSVTFDRLQTLFFWDLSAREALLWSLLQTVVTQISSHLRVLGSSVWARYTFIELKSWYCKICRRQVQAKNSSPSKDGATAGRKKACVLGLQRKLETDIESRSWPMTKGLQETPVTFETMWLLRRTRPPQMGQDSSQFSPEQRESSGYSAPRLRRGSDADLVLTGLFFFFLRLVFYSLRNMLRAKVTKINTLFNPRDHAPVWLRKVTALLQTSTASSIKRKLSHLP